MKEGFKRLGPLFPSGGQLFFCFIGDHSVLKDSSEVIATPSVARGSNLFHRI
jgi:hypothetical protein